MNSSILLTVKKLLGIYESDTSFDTDLLIHINTALNILSQIGVGPSTGFIIVDDSSEWDELLLGDQMLEMCKTYVALNVRKAFDPPQNGNTMQALNDVLSELTYRILVQTELK